MNKIRHQRRSSDDPIEAVDEFIARTKELDGNFILYRGLADSDWGVEASGYRRIKIEEREPVPLSVFRNSIERLLDNAKLRGFRERQGRSFFDLELLADLQHNGAATCLIDFTANPLVALWFACQENLGKDGKVVAMATDDIEEFSEVEYKSFSNSIEKFFEQGKLWKWSPSHQNNRIVAQNSIFVFGKGQIEEKHYKNVTVKSKSKEKIIRELQDRFGIAEQYLFNDFTGYALANSHNKEYKLYSADDFLQLGITFSQREEHKKAMEYYTKALEKDHQHAEAYCQRGNAKYASGDHRGAITDYGEALELNPGDFDAYFRRGNAKSDLGEYHSAIGEYDSALAIDPEFAIAYNNRGAAKGELGKYRDAIMDYSAALKINPELLEAYRDRGYSKYSLGEYEGAIADYNKAIKMDPTNGLAYYHRGIAKQFLGEQAGANQDLSKAYELNPDLKRSGND